MAWEPTQTLDILWPKITKKVNLRRGFDFKSFEIGVPLIPASHQQEH
jgi:hypothetical protein